MCPARSHDLTPCDYYLRESLKDDYINNPLTEDELKEIVGRAVSVFSRRFLIICYQVSELKEVISNASLTGGKLYSKDFSLFYERVPR